MTDVDFARQLDQVNKDLQATVAANSDRRHALEAELRAVSTQGLTSGTNTMSPLLYPDPLQCAVDRANAAGSPHHAAAGGGVGSHGSAAGGHHHQSQAVAEFLAMTGGVGAAAPAGLGFGGGGSASSGPAGTVLTSRDIITREVSSQVARESQAIEERVKQIVEREWSVRVQEIERALRTRFDDLRVLTDGNAKALKEVAMSVAATRKETADRVANLEDTYRSRFDEITRRTDGQYRQCRQELLEIKDAVLDVQQKYQCDAAEHQRRLDSAQRKQLESFHAQAIEVERTVDNFREECTKAIREVQARASAESDATQRGVHQLNERIVTVHDQVDSTRRKLEELYVDFATRRSEVRSVKQGMAQLELYCKGRLDKAADRQIPFAQVHRDPMGGDGGSLGSPVLGPGTASKMQEDLFLLKQSVAYIDSVLRACGLVDDDGEAMPAPRKKSLNTSGRRRSELGSPQDNSFGYRSGGASPITPTAAVPMYSSQIGAAGSAAVRAAGDAGSDLLHRKLQQQQQRGGGGGARVSDHRGSGGGGIGDVSAIHDSDVNVSMSTLQATARDLHRSARSDRPLDNDDDDDDGAPLGPTSGHRHSHSHHSGRHSGHTHRSEATAAPAVGDRPSIMESPTAANTTTGSGGTGTAGSGPSPGKSSSRKKSTTSSKASAKPAAKPTTTTTASGLKLHNFSKYDSTTTDDSDMEEWRRKKLSSSARSAVQEGPGDSLDATTDSMGSSTDSIDGKLAMSALN